MLILNFRTNNNFIIFITDSSWLLEGLLFLLGNGQLLFQFQALFYKERFKQYVYRPIQGINSDSNIFLQQ